MLITHDEAKSSYIYNDEYFTILPPLKSDSMDELNKIYKSNFKKVPFDAFTSADNIKDKVYLKKLLQKGKFI